MSMSMLTVCRRLAAAALFLTCLQSFPLQAQTPAPSGRQPQRPPVISPEVQSDGHVTFRLQAPQATTVRLSAGDIPGNGPGTPMVKNDNGVWEVTVGPIAPGAYRYNYNVQGVTTIDPRNSATSESNDNVWSLVVVPGSDLMDTKNVPHGAVASVTYWSTALSKFRRMHVYLPPGYDKSKDKYPVFYLLHGAGDSDEAWTSVGRAGFILDNLIAAKQAKPMVVVMPAGHTRKSGEPPSKGSDGSPVRGDEFVGDFMTDLLPYVEQHYHVQNDRAHRAIAGLSMGGSQTLNIALPHLELFAYVGVYSSGLLNGFGSPRGANPAPNAGQTRSPWEQEHLAVLDNAELKKGLKLLWFGTGKDDFLLNTTHATVDMLKTHGFQPIFEESTGGHTWLNWRNYLLGFAPKLFK
ncbi:MAG: axe1-6A 5 [Chthonomonadales bacterium]|nr:axe1-6A 5 [Chthonomonadales bacterium]